MVDQETTVGGGKVNLASNRDYNDDAIIKIFGI